MIYVTGDTHADVSRFGSKNPAMKNIGAGDTIIICGDFGLVWSGSREEKYWLDWLAEKPFQTLFVGGNHENYDMLEALPVTEWNGGTVQKLRENVIHLMRGQIFTIEGKTFFTMGGASSHDISDGILDPADPRFREKNRILRAMGALYRVNHVSWWQQELPTPEELDAGRDNLKAHGSKVDYMISHWCPGWVQDMFSEGLYKKDVLTDYFSSISKECAFTRWCFGHYHDDRKISEKYWMLYENIEPLWLPTSEKGDTPQ